MSKKSEAKTKQGYNPKAAQRVCATCKHFQFDMDWPKWMKDGKHDSYLTPENQGETNIRCGIGGFSVKKMALCDEWAVKGYI